MTIYALKRRANHTLNKLFYSLDRNMLEDAFDRVGLKSGMIVCVHTALSRIGRVVGGPDAIIDVLFSLVGRTGTVLMPSFPTGASIARYLETNPIFDVRHSPSRVGLVTEVFRRRDGVTRSLHPTNPVAGWGSLANEILGGHEDSPTPYGPETPYGRLANLDNGYVLMIETHVHSLLHHIQERVDFPNLFDGTSRATLVDWSGQTQTINTRVMRQRTPYFVAIPPVRNEQPDWAILHDYALMFPRSRRVEVKRLGYKFDGYPRLYDRRSELERLGILRTARLGRGEIGLLKVRDFVHFIEKELRTLIQDYRSYYDPQRIDGLKLPYA